MNASVWAGSGCPSEQVLLDLTLGALNADSRRRAGQHLEGCALCTESLGAAIPFLAPAQATSGAGDEALDQEATTPLAVRVSGRRSLKNGQILRDTYEIVGFVGGGAMGEVYEARHARLVGRYAIKILHLDLAGVAMARARFRREAIASELRHPNIVQVIDFDETEQGQPFLAMEFLEGRNLGELLAASGPLPVARALDLASQIGSGLSAIHRLAIIHRDLKPANVVVLPADGGQPERIKLVDFGLSRRQVPSLAMTQERALLGTPQYMAPEQARGDTDGVGPAADQFAMAALLYEMLSGRPAFSGDSLAAVLYRIVHEEPVPLGNLVPDLPIPAAIAIDRALAKQAEHRFPSVQAFVDALTAAAADPRTADGPTRPDMVAVAPPGLRSSRRRVLAIGAGALAAAAIGVRLWIGGAQRRDRVEPAIRQSVTAGATTGVQAREKERAASGASAEDSPANSTLPVTVEESARVVAASADHRKKKQRPARAVSQAPTAVGPPPPVSPPLEAAPQGGPIEGLAGAGGESAAPVTIPVEPRVSRDENSIESKKVERREKKPKVTAF